MTHDYQRAAEAEREFMDAMDMEEEARAAVKARADLPRAGVFSAVIVALALGAVGLWMAFG